MAATAICHDNLFVGAFIVLFGDRRLDVFSDIILIRLYLVRLEVSVNFIFVIGIIYDVIVEPPSVGSTTDEHGHSRPVAFMPNRVNGQYIMEGLASSFLFSLGGIGFIILDRTHNPSTPKLNRILLISVAFLCILVSFCTTWIFMRMKLPGYLQN